MAGRLILIWKALALGALVVAVFAALALTPSRPDVEANSWAGNPLPPLLSCPNVDGSLENKVQVADILTVVQKYGRDYGEAGYAYLYDSVSPYNKDNPTGTGGISINDILYVVQRYNQTCPLVDTEVALAAKWAIQNVPMTEDPTALANLGYVHGSTNVPGQGVHYVKLANFDANFDPQAPEGLVYDDGRLAAGLYVVNGDIAGWAEDPLSASPGACWDGVDNGGDGLTDNADGDCGSGDPGVAPQCQQPPCPPLDDVNIDPLVHNCTGAVVPNECSWNGSEGWHLHYRLCTIHVGTSSAAAFTMAPGSTATDCQNAHNSSPCNGAGCPGAWSYNLRVGWMGHLWNFLPNANLLPDVNGTQNGRFADCYPDGGVWKAYNCPQ